MKPKRGYTARLAKAASGYFYFQSGEAADWLDRTVNVPTVNSLSLAEWVAEFERLRTGFPSLYPRTIKVASANTLSSSTSGSGSSSQ